LILIMRKGFALFAESVCSPYLMSARNAVGKMIHYSTKILIMLEARTR